MCDISDKFDEYVDEIVSCRGLVGSCDYESFEAGWQAARSQGDAEPVRDRVRDALAESLGDAMDCTRVWEAWSVGTMGPEDFVVITEDDERLEELVDAAMSALSGVNCKSCGDFGSDCDVCGHSNYAAPSPEVLAETLANDLFEVGREPDREVYRIQFMAGDMYEEKGCGGLNKKALTRWLTGRLSKLLSTNATPPRPEWVKCSEMDDDLRWILGRPNFACSGIAQHLRKQGQEVKCKAEDEQAAAIHWMLKLYVEHGPEWRKEASALLRECPNPPEQGGE